MYVDVHALCDQADFTQTGGPAIGMPSVRGEGLVEAASLFS